MASTLKDLVGNMPAVAALYDAVRPKRPRTRYNLEQLEAHLPAAVEQVRPYARTARPGIHVLIFATLHYWIEQAAIIGLVLRAMGHDVTLAYLPYSNWQKEINAFDLRRQDLYTQRVLARLDGLVKPVALLGKGSDAPLPEELERALESHAAFDVMYSLQTEIFDRESPLYHLRMHRNRHAAASALSLLQSQRPDTVLIPNGLVTELGVFFQASRYLNLTTVTYEFNDQREQIWIAQNDVVMRQNTDDLWAARGNRPLTDGERQRIAEFEEARSSATTYGKGTRAWQDATAEGGEALRKSLHLDHRPVVLLATNVLGDSLTLGRHIFASSMAEWVERTVSYFVQRPDVQLVIRVHPGERLIKGPSMMKVIERAASGQPEHIHVIGPSEKTNTYDIMEVADLGLTYTTTVGMEMAMRGVPVIVGGSTHYRGRGFTLDASTWTEYFALLDKSLKNLPSQRLASDRIETAWNYAYRFFFEFPFDFPWRLMHFWQDVEIWPLKRVLSEDGQDSFGRTFRHLAGEKIRW